MQTPDHYADNVRDCLRSMATLDQADAALAVGLAQVQATLAVAAAINLATTALADLDGAPDRPRQAVKYATPDYPEGEF